MKGTLLLAAMLCVAAPAVAADAPASAESIRAVFALTRPQRVMDIAKAQIKDSFDAGIKAGLGEARLNADQQAILDDYKGKIVALLQDSFDWAKFEPAAIDAYSRTFSQKEIDGMLAFYRSETGRAVLEKIPALTQAMMQNVQNQMRAMLPQVAQLREEMLTRIKEHATKEGPASP